jgi:predicted regulator of Ras-like GTPase activity (Roadblock/LC7/MglB family)
MNSLKAELTRKRCKEILQISMTGAPAAEFFCLGLTDGRVWAYQGPDALDPVRLAAMSTSALALNEAYAKELRFGHLRYGVSALESGSIVSVRVPSSPSVFALSCGFAASETVAMALRTSLDTADRLAEVINAAGLVVTRTKSE